MLISIRLFISYPTSHTLFGKHVTNNRSTYYLFIRNDQSPLQTNNKHKSIIVYEVIVRKRSEVCLAKSTILCDEHFHRQAGYRSDEILSQNEPL